ncbi:cobalt-precorrin-7 (C(5))-methyltransferase [Hippea sp. KM1]|uniref:cobalt-precorrin-7 (C(5))-methyltransferase n=1 Tax=Hippea sp. KM1 TaxID=944481 RepID=UPI00046D4306|nr:cobalt-precorrin-7 (C(5))-methyltransferase [Hippea sp. KM1]
MEGHRFIYIISAGCGSEDYLTIKAKKTAKEMDVLIGHKRFKSLFDAPFVELKNLSDHLDELIRQYWGKRIGVVVSGDAGFFSLAKTIYKRYDPYIAEVIPGISSFQLLFAKLKRGYEEVGFFSAHSQNPISLSLPKESFVLLCGKNKTEILDAWRDLSKDFDIFAGCNLSLNDERVFKLKTEKDIEALNECKLCILFFERKNDG